ncbi:hypothetical protein [Paenibacillus baekrokdamisoli]|nr:hypothetical protein [Paenibacillus baekrokdamisoli]
MILVLLIAIFPIDIVFSKPSDNATKYPPSPVISPAGPAKMQTVRKRVKADDDVFPITKWFQRDSNDWIAQLNNSQVIARNVGGCYDPYPAKTQVAAVLNYE